MNNDVMFSSATDQWATPQEFFDKLDAEFGFNLDPCADETNHKCTEYYTRKDNGLEQNWGGKRVFCNPPYGREIWKWVEKCFSEVRNGSCELAVMLIPVRTDTKWFHDYINGKADEIRFVRGRLKFGGSPNGAPFPSMVVVYKHLKDVMD